VLPSPVCLIIRVFYPFLYSLKKLSLTLAWKSSSSLSSKTKAMVVLCKVCRGFFLDDKHLADHEWSSSCSIPSTLAPLCKEHADLVGVVPSNGDKRSLELEKMLHRAISHRNCSFPGLRLEFLTLQVRKRKFERKVPFS